MTHTLLPLAGWQDSEGGHLHNAIPVTEALVAGLTVGKLAREATGALVAADT